MKIIILLLCSLLLACAGKPYPEPYSKFPTRELQVGVIIREPAYITFYIEDDIGKTQAVQSNEQNTYLYDKAFAHEFTQIARDLYGDDFFSKSVKQNLLPIMQQCRFNIKMISNSYYNFELREDLNSVERWSAMNSIISLNESPSYYAQRPYFKLKTVPPDVDYVLIIDGDLEYNTYQNIPKDPLSSIYTQIKGPGPSSTVGYRPKVYVQAEFYNSEGIPFARFRTKQTGEAEKRGKYIFSSQQDVIKNAPVALQGLLEYDILALKKLATEICQNR